MKVSVKIGLATVSTQINTLEEFWNIIIPTMMAAGYCMETAKDSLHHWILNEHSEFLAEHSEPKESETPIAETWEWGDQYDKGYTDGYNGEFATMNSKAYTQGYEDGERAYEEESGSESESENQSTCGND